MIGVVVWSSEERHKAVIWCEDQGALAYLHGLQNLVQQAGWPLAGDLVELEAEADDDHLRHARNVAILNREHCVALPDMLLGAAAEEPQIRLVVSDGKPVDRNGRNGTDDQRAIARRRIAGYGR